MKKVLLTMLIVIFGLPILAQDVQFPPSVLAGGGGSSANNVVNITKWRLSQVHIITLPDDKTTDEELLQDELITVYPNPVEELFKIEFNMEESMDCTIRITDLLGRIHLILNPRTILPGEVIELEFSEFIPAMYLLHIESPNQKIWRSFPIQKL